MYDRALDFLYAESGLAVAAGPETFLVCPRARNFVSLEADVYTYLKANVRPGNTVLDIGAFLGLYAIVSARFAGAAGRVIACEPTPSSLPLLYRHLAMNRVQQTVTTLPCAVGKLHGGVELFQHREAYRNAVGVKDPIAGDAAVAVRVPMLSIDEICALFELRPDVIRMDVQGLESEVLEGAAQTIGSCPMLKIIVEIHPQLWPSHGLTVQKFRRQVTQLGLTDTAPDGTVAAYSPDAHVVLQRAIA
jgi:FkbM family methyltransferase